MPHFANGRLLVATVLEQEMMLPCCCAQQGKVTVLKLAAKSYVTQILLPSILIHNNR